MSSPRAADVVVVGAGLIGAAAAWRTQSSGARVVLVDDRPASGASWAAAGMLAPVTEVHYGEEPLLQLNLAAAERYPTFVAELEAATGHEVGYRACGTLAVARDADENAALAELFSFQRDLGLEVERLRSREVRELEPALAPSVRGGILVAGDHQVDNRALMNALLEAARRSGTRHVARRARALAIDGGRVGGVVLDDGSAITAGVVVLAAGWASAALEGLPPDLHLPLRPVKGQLLHLRGPAAPALVERTVRGSDVYVVPRADGRVVVGATMEERGEDRRVTAGAMLELLRSAYELLPGITELELTETVAGLRPGSPDNAPLIGPAGPDGLVLATGHHRNGVLLTPVTADAVAAIATTGEVPALVRPFGPQRFSVNERSGAR